MSSKVEKKQKVSARASGGRGGTGRRTTQEVLASQAEESLLPSTEPQPEPEALKEEPGGYLLESSSEAQCLRLKRVRGLLLLG